MPQRVKPRVGSRWRIGALSACVSMRMSRPRSAARADCGGKYPASAAVGGDAVQGEVGRVRQPCTVAAGIGWLRCVHKAECACGVDRRPPLCGSSRGLYRPWRLLRRGMGISIVSCCPMPAWQLLPGIYAQHFGYIGKGGFAYGFSILQICEKKRPA